MSYDPGTAHFTPASIASLPVPSRVSPSGSSKRKSKPVKRIVDDPVEEAINYEENREPSSLDTTIESVMQMASDGGYKPGNLERSEIEDSESESTKKAAVNEMDQLDALKRFAEILMASQNGLQTLLSSAGCNLPQMMAPSLPNHLTSESALAANNGLMQSMLHSSLAGLFPNSATSPLTPNTTLFSGLINSNVNKTDITSAPNTPTVTTSQAASSLANSKGPLKRKLFDLNKEISGQAAPAITKEERIDMDDLENFAQQFKKQRIKFGFTQGDVGVALGKRYGTDFSQTTISRFEALNLSFKNMCKLRPLLKEWLADAESAIANGASLHDLLDKPTPSKPIVGHSQPVPSEVVASMVSPGSLGIPLEPSVKRRRKRTNLDLAQRSTLDAYFTLNPRPDHDRMTEIANLLELDRDVVRVWFCNRRQKVRRSDDPEPDSQLLASLKALQDGAMSMGGLAASSSDMGTSSSLSPTSGRNSLSMEASPEAEDFSQHDEDAPESP